MARPQRIQLIHWNAGEAEERAGRLAWCGYDVDRDVPAGPRLLRKLREDPPAAVVIDLGRLPSQGRDVALAIRVSGRTRQVPLVFVGGDPEKVEAIRARLPDAVYTTWSRIRSALARAIANPPRSPIVPRSVLDAYAGGPLHKLGFKAGADVALIHPQPGFAAVLDPLPPAVRLRSHARGRCD